MKMARKMETTRMARFSNQTLRLAYVQTAGGTCPSWFHTGVPFVSQLHPVGLGIGGFFGWGAGANWRGDSGGVKKVPIRGADAAARAAVPATDAARPGAVSLAVACAMLPQGTRFTRQS